MYWRTRIQNSSALTSAVSSAVRSGRAKKSLAGADWNAHSVRFTLSMLSVSCLRVAASEILDYLGRLKRLRSRCSTRLLPLELHAISRLYVNAAALKCIRLILLFID